MRFGNDAIAWARNRLGSHAYDGLCERFRALSLRLRPDYGSAKQGVERRRRQATPVRRVPPPAVPVFWNLAGPNSAYGHVALSIGGGAHLHVERARVPGRVHHFDRGVHGSQRALLGLGRDIPRHARLHRIQDTAAWYDRAIDGEFGAASVTGLQRFLARHGFYRGAVDGTWGP